MTLAALIAALSVPSLHLDAAISEAKLDELLKQGLDVKVIVSLIEKECVDFAIGAENISQYSAKWPAEVLNAAITCERSATVAPTGTQASPQTLKPVATLDRTELFNQIRVGATEAEVRKLIGLPEARVEALFEDMERLTLPDLFSPPTLEAIYPAAGWFYSLNAGRAGKVRFERGVVQSTEIFEDPALPSPPEGLSEAQADYHAELSKINVGASWAHVNRSPRGHLEMPEGVVRDLIKGIGDLLELQIGVSLNSVTLKGIAFVQAQEPVLTTLFVNEKCIFLIHTREDFPLPHGAHVRDSLGSAFQRSKNAQTDKEITEVWWGTEPQLTHSEAGVLENAAERMKRFESTLDQSDFASMKGVALVRTLHRSERKDIEALGVATGAGTLRFAISSGGTPNSVTAEVSAPFAFVPDLADDTRSALLQWRSIELGWSERKVTKLVGGPPYRAAEFTLRSTRFQKYKEVEYVRADGLYMFCVFRNDSLILVTDALLPVNWGGFRQNGIDTRAAFNLRLAEIPRLNPGRERLFGDDKPVYIIRRRR